jgi:hypothetical protein
VLQGRAVLEFWGATEQGIGVSHRAQCITATRGRSDTLSGPRYQLAARISVVRGEVFWSYAAGIAGRKTSACPPTARWLSPLPLLSRLALNSPH